MDYNELKMKYAADAGARAGKRERLTNDVKLAQAKYDQLNEQIERLRPVGAGDFISAEDARKRDELRVLRADAAGALKKAQSDLSSFEAEIIDLNEVTNSITH